MKTLLVKFFAVGMMFLSSLVLAQDAGFDESLLSIQHQWAHVNYELSGDEQEQAYMALVSDAQAMTNRFEDKAEAWIWYGIVQSSAAGAKGGMGALKLAKSAKKAFETAINLNSNALDGSAMTSLGVLYHKLPGWPISFGSDKKAGKLLKDALAINPNGIDPNYFYAEFLFDEGDYQGAKHYLELANQAPPRLDRPLADKGRKGEIQQLMQKIEAKL